METDPTGKENTDSPLPKLPYSSNLSTLAKKEIVYPTDASTATSLERTISVHTTSLKTIAVPFDAETEMKRLSNLRANRGPDPGKPSIPEEE